jgi:MATE family multidrug resistance protein
VNDASSAYRPQPSAATGSFGGHLAATLKLGLPLVGTQVAQIMIGVTDTVMIGWLGARELAAATLGGNVFFVALMLGSGFAFAVIPVVAQARGRGDDRTVRRALRMAIWIVLGYSALLMGPLWMIEPVLNALGQEPEVAALAAKYSRIMQWTLFPMLCVMTVRGFLSALERPRPMLIATIVAVIVNAFLNYALIFGNWGAPRLELQGAAIASVLSACVSLAVGIAYLAWTPALRRMELLIRPLRPDWESLREILHLGWPISLTVIAEIGMFTASSIMMGWVSTIALAAHGIALQLASLIFMVPLGLASAATVHVGGAVGRGDGRGVLLAAQAVIAIGAAVAIFGAACFLLAPQPLVRIFLDLANPDAAEVETYAILLLAVAAAFQLVDGLQALASGLLRGLKDMRTPMMLAVISYWVVGIPAAWWLGFPAGLAGVGIWVGLAIGLACAALLLTVRFFLLARRFAGNRATVT